LRTRRTLPSIALLIALLYPGFPIAGTVDHREAFSRLPASPEVLYLPAKYSACFGCHPARKVIEEEDFNVETDFRDTVLGKNLHSIHVYRQPQGTNCSACHRADAATGAPSFLPGIRLAMSEKGGRCAPACHRLKEYRNAGRRR
jgi:mono/diheme cytochrome c family protein